MEPITVVTGKTAVLEAANIDTDRIIPARFLKGTRRDGLGPHLFADWRYDSSGTPRASFPLNQPAAQGASVLVAGDNFGCGSSREHAAWALVDYGFRAIVSTSFADIFRANALKNGLLPIALAPETHRALVGQPGVVLSIDLATQVLRLPNGEIAHFAIDPFACHCLTNGLDELGFLLAQLPAIEAYERRQA
jgi:3-isopropylmalate/(R)-2-methylmalate dehydratase small subunit